MSESLLEALSQFMEMFPHMTKGQGAEDTDFFAFGNFRDEEIMKSFPNVSFFFQKGESYGGSYVVSLARSYLLAKQDDSTDVGKIKFK